LSPDNLRSLSTEEISSINHLHQRIEIVLKDREKLLS
jgi:hypothetical protein